MANVPGNQPPRQKITTRVRDAKIAELTLQGWHQHKIARELGCHQTTVCRSLQRTLDLAAQELSEGDGRRLQARMLMQLGHIHDEAKLAWEKSKGDGLTVKETDGGGDSDGKVERTTKKQTGDPRYLEVARKSIEDVAKLVGIAPVVNTGDTTTIVHHQQLQVLLHDDNARDAIITLAGKLAGTNPASGDPGESRDHSQQRQVEDGTSPRAVESEASATIDGTDQATDCGNATPPRQE